MKKEQHISKLERITIQITRWMGTTTSIIVHTIFFVEVFTLYLFGISFEQILLILTTAVSLEAIYLALFIQMTVNRNTESLEGVEEDIDEIQEDVEDVEGDIDEIQEDVEDLGEDFEDISEDIDKMHAEKPAKHQTTHPTISQQLDHITKELASIKSLLNKS